MTILLTLLSTIGLIGLLVMRARRPQHVPIPVRVTPRDRMRPPPNQR